MTPLANDAQQKRPPRSLWIKGIIGIGVAFSLLLIVVTINETRKYLRDPVAYNAALAEDEARRARETRDHEAKRAQDALLVATAAARKKSAQAAEAAAAERSGLKCLMGGDGSNPSTVREVKQTLRDPDSFQHIDTVIYPRIHGQHALIMKYRAKNGFGGMNVEVARARIDASNCQATLLAGRGE